LVLSHCRLRRALSSVNHAEKLLPRQRIVAEAAEHAAGDQI
jgi:hypothetical protein